MSASVAGRVVTASAGWREVFGAEEDMLRIRVRGAGEREAGDRLRAGVLLVLVGTEE